MTSLTAVQVSLQKREELSQVIMCPRMLRHASGRFLQIFGCFDIHFLFAKQQTQ